MIFFFVFFFPNLYELTFLMYIIFLTKHFFVCGLLYNIFVVNLT